ncbi:hypothetical protein HK101_009583 [Irineochytrium annulatum]|nr:hypothetical protein HK101_009583 [Irineochytrium annulatum]
MFIARGAASVLNTLASPLLGVLPSANPLSNRADAPHTSSTTAAGGTDLATSVFALSDSDGKVDYLAVADYVSCTVNAGISAAAKALVGYDLEFAVHRSGAILVTGAGGRVGAHAARTLCAMGYTVFAGIRTPEEGRRLVSRVSRDGSRGTLVPVMLDVTSPESLRACYELICARLGVSAEDPGKRDAKAQREALGLATSPRPGLDTVAEGAEEMTEAVALGGYIPPPASQSRASASRSPNGTSSSPAAPGALLRGHSRLGTSPPMFADDCETDEEDVLSVPSRPTSPAAGPAAGEDPSAHMLVGIVNCEGTESPGPVEMLPLAEMMRAYEVNTAGAVAVTQCLLPLLRISRGRIVNVCSSTGVTAAPINGSYAASKMALEAISDSLRVELYPFGISVSIIEPGSLDALSWSPPATGAKLTERPETHSHQLHRPMTPMTSAPGILTPTSPTPLSSTSVQPKGRTTPTIYTAASLRPPHGPISPISPTSHTSSLSAAAPHHPSYAAFPSGGPLSLRPMTSDHHAAHHSPEPSSPPRRNPPPRSWSSLSQYGRQHHDDAPFAPAAERHYATSPSNSRDALDAAGPSLIPLPSRFVATRRGSVGSATPSTLRRRHNAGSRSRSPGAGTLSPPPPEATRRSFTPQPSSRPNRMYEPPLPEPTAVVGREWSHHPIWDSEDLAGVSRRLYGPLIDAVRELAESASGSTTRPAAPSTPGSRRNRGGDSTGKSPAQTDDASRRPKPDVGQSKHTSRAIAHALTSSYPKTRYRVGWDARATAYLRWALPDRVLDWGFQALSGREREAIERRERKERERRERREREAEERRQKERVEKEEKERAGEKEKSAYKFFFDAHLNIHLLDNL